MTNRKKRRCNACRAASGREETCCYPTYPSVEIARQSLARYIEEYNERRPHQALWNYTPGYVHKLGNNTKLLHRHREIIQIVKKHRVNENRTSIAMV